jgi:hypothetical protein
MAIPDAQITISQADLIHVLRCALFWDSKLPYGQVPPKIWEALNQEGKDWVIENMGKPGSKETDEPSRDLSFAFGF